MINHARTLLLNVLTAPDYTEVGEEYISPDFRPMKLSAALQAIRREFFGANPDRLMLNYRGWQLLNLVAATELQPFLLALDSRITYDLTRSVLFDYPFDRLQAEQYTGDVLPISLLGSPGVVPDAAGTCRYGWRAELLSPTAMRVRRFQPTIEGLETGYTVEQGLSSSIPLLGTRHSFRVSLPAGESSWADFTTDWDNLSGDTWDDRDDNSPNPGWAFSLAVRPQRDLADIAIGLSKLGEPALLELFQVGSPLGQQEPWSTFRQLWTHHPELPYRLSGVVAALIYHMDYLRRGSP